MTNTIQRSTNPITDTQTIIKQQTEIIQQAENTILELDEKLRSAKELIGAMESSKFWKLREKWFNVKNKLGLVSQTEKTEDWQNKLALSSPAKLPQIPHYSEPSFTPETTTTVEEKPTSSVDLHLQYIQSQIEPFTFVGPERMESLYNLAQRIEIDNIPGDVLECGICNGGTAAILTHFATHSRKYHRTVWLFDSFAGMPETTEEDEEEAKKCVGKVIGKLDKVLKVLDLVNSDMEKVKIIDGWFEDTFPTVHIPEIALLNIDADWYASVKLCLDTFYDAVVPGGFISFDDYGHWPGCRKAVDEFFAERQLTYQLQEVDYTARWFQKL